jgi:transposase
MNSILQPFAPHPLPAKDKKPLQVICAVMRKLLHAIHGMLQKDEPFDNTRFYAIPASVE